MLDTTSGRHSEGSLTSGDERDRERTNEGEGLSTGQRRIQPGDSTHSGDAASTA
jgi:hypothetical protein